MNNWSSNFSGKSNSNWTWEGKDYASWIKTSSSWIKNSNKYEEYDVPAIMTDKDMMSDISDRLDEPGFFDDCLDWLVEMAPRKISGFLRSLCVGNNRVNHATLCKAVYDMGFRASEVVERRMILGETNEWVRMYFEDFPFRK